VASCITIIFKESDLGKSHSFKPTEIIYMTNGDFWELTLFDRIFNRGFKASGFSTSISIPSTDEWTWPKYSYGTFSTRIPIVYNQYLIG